MNILAFDTSGESSSVAFLSDETIGVECCLNRGGRHEETLLLTIQDVLVRAGITMGEIDLFAVTVGPGSFTGLRVGLSTVKGLAFAAGKPVAGVSALEALAANIPHADVSVCPMMDARRGDVYAAMYRVEGGRLPGMTAEERVTTPEKVMEMIDGMALFLGDGAMRYEDMIREHLAERAIFVPHSFNAIRGGAVGLIGLKKYRDGDILSARELVPRYLRPSYAEQDH